MFISWGAEEYGLIGSQEWVEEKLTVLQARSIAYINCDLGVSGNYTFTIGNTKTTIVIHV
jgi:N-acetylated-alpha-linked acidic dipeptidase